MAPKSAAAAPPWAGMKGTKRIMAEFKYIGKQVSGLFAAAHTRKH